MKQLISDFIGSFILFSMFYVMFVFAGIMQQHQSCLNGDSSYCISEDFE